MTASADPHSSTQSATQRQELWERAARCYRQAELNADAARCYRNTGNFPVAAILFEKSGDWLAAARCCVRAQQWVHAAFCFQRVGRMEDAAEALLSSGDPLSAGWLLAHATPHWERALAILSRVEATDPATEMALRLAQSRCQAARQPIPAAQAILAAIRMLDDLSQDHARQRIIDWAMALAEVLHRPDLLIGLHASGVRLGMSQARQNWEAWAINRFGKADGVPVEPEAAEEASVAAGKGDER